MKKKLARLFLDNCLCFQGSHHLIKYIKNSNDEIDFWKSIIVQLFIIRWLGWPNFEIYCFKRNFVWSYAPALSSYTPSIKFIHSLYQVHVELLQSINPSLEQITKHISDLGEKIKTFRRIIEDFSRADLRRVFSPLTSPTNYPRYWVVLTNYPRYWVVLTNYPR